MTQTSSIVPLRNDRSHGEDAMTMSHISPSGWRKRDEMVTEVYESLDVLPVIEIVVLDAAENVIRRYS